MISLMRWAGDRSRTEWTVRSNTDQASLWKQMTTLVAGNLSKYRPGSLHLLDTHQIAQLIATNVSRHYLLGLISFIRAYVLTHSHNNSTDVITET